MITPQRLLTEPIVNKECTDPVVIRMMDQLGVPIERVEFCKEYNARQHGGSPYSKGYKFTDGIINKTHHILVSQGLAMCDSDSYSLDPGWTYDSLTGAYVSQHNLFRATVKGTQCEIEVLCDQPDGRKAGQKVQFQPELFLDEKLWKPKSITPEWIDDPANPNYKANVLVWDYEWCRRYSRIIEGKLINRWVIIENPGKDFRFDYNQTGDWFLKLGRFAVSPDREIVTAKQYEQLAAIAAMLQIPVAIGDSSTFYPDTGSGGGNTSVDGYLFWSGNDIWSNAVGAATGTARDTEDYAYSYVSTSNTSDQFSSVYRPILVFDTSDLPSGLSISGSTITLRGTNSYTTLGTPTIIIVSSAPASDGSLVAGDYDSLGTTSLANEIAEGSWNSSGDNVFTLNETGIAAIDDAGASKFGSRLKCDPSDKPTWVASKAMGFQFYCADYGSNKPALAVTYSTGGNYTESASVAIGLSVSGSRSTDIERLANVAIGEAVSAGREFIAERSASVAVGLSVAASKVFNRVRSAAVAVGLSITAGRATEIARSAAQSIGLSVSASRVTEIARSASNAIGLSVTASRATTIARTAATAVGLSITGSIARALSAAVSIGLSVSASRATDIARSASAAIGASVTAGRATEIARSAATAVGLSVTASKGIAIASAVAIGLSVSASRMADLGRSATTAVGLSVTASRVTEILRSASVAVGLTPTGSRLFIAARSASTSIGLSVTATVTSAVVFINGVLTIVSKWFTKWNVRTLDSNTATRTLDSNTDERTIESTEE